MQESKQFEVECNDIQCKAHFQVAEDKIRGSRTALVLCPQCGRFDAAYVISKPTDQTLTF